MLPNTQTTILNSESFDDYVDTADFIRNPFPYYEHLRVNAPIQWSEKWKCWVVFSYEDCCNCLKDPKKFSNVGRVTGLFHSFLDAKQMEQLKPLIRHYSEGLINIDPPEHRRLRKILQKVFMPSVIKEMAGAITDRVDRLLDQACQGKNQMDLIHEFSHPLPVSVIAEMFGVPKDQTYLFTKWSAGIVRFMQSPRPTFEDCLYSQQHLLDLRAFLKAGIEARKKEPKTDLLGLLVDAEEDGERLSDDEIISTSVTILLGGHETTTRLIANTVYDLLHRPDQLQRLIDEPELIPTAIEEFVRFSGPFHRDQRVAAVDLELNGHSVKKGDYILMMLQSANRDPAVFEDPDMLKIERNPRKQIGFGSGPHVCLGAHLARLEVSIAMTHLLERCQSIKLVEEPEWEYGFLRGPKKLLISWQA